MKNSLQLYCVYHLRSHIYLMDSDASISFILINSCKFLGTLVDQKMETNVHSAHAFKIVSLIR